MGILRDYVAVFGAGADATPLRSSLPTLANVHVDKKYVKIRCKIPIKSQIIFLSDLCPNARCATLALIVAPLPPPMLGVIIVTIVSRLKPSCLHPNPPTHWLTCLILLKTIFPVPPPSTGPLPWMKSSTPARGTSGGGWCIWDLCKGHKLLGFLSRATAVANVPSASKIENTIEYFDTLTDLNCGWKKSCFHWHGHCPVHFACASVCDHPKPTPAVQTTSKPLPVAGTLCALLNTLQHGSRTIVPAALAAFRMLGALHRRPRTTLLAALAAFRVLGLLRAFPEAGAKVEEYLVGPHRQPQRYFATHAVPFYPHSTPSRSSPPPSSSPPAYSPPSRSLSPLVATRQRPCPDPAPSWEFSMSMGGKSQHNKPRLFACDNPPTPLRAHSPEPDHGVKTEPKPRTKTEPEPCVKREVKLKLNLQHDVERLRSHSHVYLYNPDSESDDSMVWMCL
ncbi:hypothetical protein B0H14DRAFT_2556202 [Mycena olivaceomarginata]|nr:hypothetical protein B0H14DRAFT_2556202 [Mycena olivaceomarginata]